MRRLILLRHAKSDWPNGVADQERPLAARGRSAAPRMGAYMAQQGLVADRVLVSPTRRTRETWELVSTQMPPVPTVSSEPRIYEATSGRLLTVVREQPRQVHTLMLIGHNPGFEDLASTLIAGGAAPDLERLSEKFPTCGLAVIDLPVDDWAAALPASGRLDRFVTPRELMGAA